VGARDDAPLVLDADPLELERYALQQDYHRFIRKAWAVIEPGVNFSDGLPIRAVTEAVQALMEGTLGRRNLLVNIPPRCMKSTSISVALTPWVWARPEWAHLKFLYTSYAGELSIRDSVKARMLMASPWYQRLFGQNFRLTSDAKIRLTNNQNGYRIATSVTGQGTGEGGDIIVSDDPHNAAEAESDAVREGTVTWWRETMSTRGNDPRTVKRIVVMQRLHEADLSGHILAEEFDDYVHLCLPMRYEPQVYVSGRAPMVTFKDPRKEGELLWPERFPEVETAKIERKLGSYGTAGQFQQRPAPRGGGLIKEDDIMLWPADEPLPSLTYVLQSYDTALTDKTSSDPTACTVWGCFTMDGVKCALLLEAWDDKLTYTPLRKRIIKDWSAKYDQQENDPLHPGRRADNIIIENKGSGISILQDLNAAKVPAFSYNPGRADKTARVMQALPIIETHVIYVLESKREPGLPVTWARDAIKQWTQFPAAAHDDYVDTLTQAIIFLRDIGFLTLAEVEDTEEEEADYTKKRGNPYNQ
jgi:predicted phage terminase large subunit-like protein